MNAIEKARKAVRDNVIKMYNEGELVRVIAAKNNITPQMVHYILRQNKVELRRK